MPTATPIPAPVLFADARVTDCLFDPACSGLFVSGAVRKSEAMGAHRYWVDANLPARTQEVIRTQVMPELETWTHHEWTESEEQAGALQWHEGDSYFGRWCGDKDDWAGCAVLGGDVIGLRRYATGPEGEQVIIPARVMYEIGLHEALHALYAAEHTQSGIMCVEEGPKRRVSRTCGAVGSYIAQPWFWPLRLHPIQEQVYTLYGNPLLTDGMSRETVALLVAER